MIKANAAFLDPVGVRLEPARIAPHDLAPDNKRDPCAFLNAGTRQFNYRAFGWRGAKDVACNCGFGTIPVRFDESARTVSIGNYDMIDKAHGACVGACPNTVLLVREDIFGRRIVDPQLCQPETADANIDVPIFCVTRRDVVAITPVPFNVWVTVVPFRIDSESPVVF